MSHSEARRPTAGEKFYVAEDPDDEDAEMQEYEIDEVVSENEDGSFNVGSDGDFYDISWNTDRSRWEEQP